MLSFSLEQLLTYLLIEDVFDLIVLASCCTFLVNVLEECLVVLGNAGCDVVTILLLLHLLVLVDHHISHFVHHLLDPCTSLSNSYFSFLLHI